jgi:hypothetical protein
VKYLAWWFVEEEVMRRDQKDDKGGEIFCPQVDSHLATQTK